MSNYTPHNILLTGGAGFIGSNVVLHLMEKYPFYHIVVLDKLNLCSSINNLSFVHDNPNFKFVRGDISSADLVYYLLLAERIDTILHFAAETHVDNSFGNSLHFTDSNIRGTHTLLEACKSVGKQIQRFIHVSTDEVYGEGSLEFKSTENSAVNPTNPYAATKAGAEFLVKSYCTSFQLPCIITRGNNVYGPRQYPEKVIPKFISLLSRGNPLPIHGSGKNRRSFLYVEDVAFAFDCILHKGKIGQIYNIGCEFEYENIEIARELIQIFRNSKYKHLLNDNKSDEEYIYHVRDRAFNDFRYHISSAELYKLGWQPQFTDFNKGLQTTVEWYLNNPNHWKNVELALQPHPTETAVLCNPANDEQGGWKAHSPSNDEKRGLEGAQPLLWLIYGGKGWIGGLVLDIINRLRPSDTWSIANSRADDEAAVEEELVRIKPDRVISLIGRTHGPGFSTIDYLEQPGKLPININDNLFSPMVLWAICNRLNIHLTYMGTGCIFKYDADHPIDFAEKNFIEESKPNFFGSSYSIVKGFTDRLFHILPQTALNVRIRMPITGDYNPRNFITKIISYKKICSIPNSMSVLPELLPIMLDMAAEKQVGTVNLTNPGVITHNEILSLYKDLVDPDFVWENFSIEEQNKILASERSNNSLGTERLLKYRPNVKPIKEAVIEVLKGLKEGLCPFQPPVML